MASVGWDSTMKQQETGPPEELLILGIAPNYQYTDMMAIRLSGSAILALRFPSGGKYFTYSYGVAPGPCLEILPRKGLISPLPILATGYRKGDGLGTGSTSL